MAVKRYDGTAWQVVAGKGDQGTSSSISTWVKTASGGETSLSGNDDNSQALSYTVGQELLFINGVLQKRGVDYTATTGTTITGLSALTANDIATVWTVNAFSVTGAIANTIVDAKGDILVGTGADTPGILAVGTNGQYLKADSTTGTGLAWATLPSSGKVLQVVSTTAGNTTSSTNVYVDHISLSITPSSTSSKVLVLFSAGNVRKVNDAGADIKLVRGSTDIQYLSTIAGYTASTAENRVGSVSCAKLDSPSTTSATTYKIQLRSFYNNSSVAINPNDDTSTLTLLEIGA